MHRNIFRPSAFAGLLILGLAGGLAAAQPSTQSVDKEYTVKIQELTTEKFFLTELVDHLPASGTVPSPLKVLGHIAGAADILDHSAEIYKYMRTLAAASQRVQVFSIGPTDEGREMIAVAVSSESNLGRGCGPTRSRGLAHLLDHRRPPFPGVRRARDDDGTRLSAGR
jgi:hypothetical protein